MGKFATLKFTISLLLFANICHGESTTKYSESPTTLVKEQSLQLVNSLSLTKLDKAKLLVQLRLIKGIPRHFHNSDFENDFNLNAIWANPSNYGVRSKRAVSAKDRPRDSRGRFIKATTPKPKPIPTTKKPATQKSPSLPRAPSGTHARLNSHAVRKSAISSRAPVHHAKSPSSSHQQSHHKRQYAAKPHSANHARNHLRNPHSTHKSASTISAKRPNTAHTQTRRIGTLRDHKSPLTSARLSHINQNRRDVIRKSSGVVKADSVVGDKKPTAHNTVKPQETVKTEQRHPTNTKSDQNIQKVQKSETTTKADSRPKKVDSESKVRCRRSTSPPCSLSPVRPTSTRRPIRIAAQRARALQSSSRTRSNDETKFPETSNPSADSTIGGQRYLRRASVSYQALPKTEVVGDDGRKIMVGYKTSTINDPGGPADGLQKVERVEADLTNIGKHDTNPSAGVRKALGTNPGGVNHGYQAGHILPALMKGPNDQPWNFFPVNPELNRKWSQVERQIKNYLESGKETKASFVFDYSKKNPNSSVPIGFKLELNPPVPGVKNGYYANPAIDRTGSTGTPPAA